MGGGGGRPSQLNLDVIMSGLALIVQLCKDLGTGTIYHLPNILEFSSLESTMTTRNSMQHYLSMMHAP